MGKISLDLSSIKAAGVYTIEIDNSTRTTTTTNAIRLCVGFSNKGPFNRPVFLERDSDRTSIFGDIDTKLEHKGCYFNRALRTLLTSGPVLALNLLKVDDTYNGPDQVNYAALSMAAGEKNPAVSVTNGTKGEYDYLSETVDSELYNTAKGDNIPFVGTTPFSSLYNRARFWTPDKELLTAAAARGLATQDYTSGAATYEHSNLLNFANVGTDEISVLVFKPENISGYDITAETWYGGSQNIPFGWIHPDDYISDYFIQVICVKGNWSNYPVLASDPVWSSYFDKKGVIKTKINNFMSAEGVTVLGAWSGIIIPDFVNKQGDNISIERKINASTEKTGLLMSFNEDAAHVISYDYSGIDTDRANAAQGAWGYDMDGDNEITAANGEGEITNGYIVDMVGHEVFMEKDITASDINLAYFSLQNSGNAGFAGNIAYEGADTFENVHSVIPTHVFGATTGLVLLKGGTESSVVKTSYFKLVGLSDDSSLAAACNDSLRSANSYAFSSFNDTITDDSSAYGYVNKSEFSSTLKTELEGLTSDEDVSISSNGSTYMLFSPFTDGTYDEDNSDTKLVYVQDEQYITGTYVPETFIDATEGKMAAATVTGFKKLINGGYVPYYTLLASGKLASKKAAISIIATDGDSDVNFADKAKEAVDTTGSVNVTVRFIIDNEPYYMDITAALVKDETTGTVKINSVYPAPDTNGVGAQMYLNYESLTEHEVEMIENATPDQAYGVTMPTGEQDGNISTTDVKGIMIPTSEDADVSGTKASVAFLSYNYVYDETTATPDVPADSDDKDSVAAENFIVNIPYAHYFNDSSIWADSAPVGDDTKNMFIITDADYWTDSFIKVGDYVRNIAYNNEEGIAAQYNLIPGITRVVKKQFIQVNSGEVTYKGSTYAYNGDSDVAKNGATGFYLLTTTASVLIEDNKIVRQLPITDDVVSHSLRFIPMKGLKLSSRHRPGYDEDGTLNIEAGIEKIYSVLEDDGIKRGLCNQAMVDFRYIIDSMSYGLDTELGGKVYLSKLACDRGKCTALLNMPSAKQFAVSSNPYFCDSYVVGTQIRPGFNTKYIPDGGNTEMGSSRVFSLPTEDDGAKYAAAFFPHLTYSENGRTISVPPAADVANVLYRKFTGVNDPYAICANTNGILSNRYLTGLEFDADTTDREYLEPFGVNTIIRDRNSIMIYGNQTCYQTLKSDYNKLHVRENLNTIEIECYEVLKQYNFLYNTAATRAAIVQMLTPILSAMQVSGALSSFEIVCDETNNTAEIIEGDYGVVDIAVWFNHGMEKIVQRITVNRYNSQSES